MIENEISMMRALADALGDRMPSHSLPSSPGSISEYKVRFYSRML